MSKFKRQTKIIIKKHDGETYIFKNGIAKVPGCSWKKRPVMIPIKEFKELTGDKK
jgi:hypothetical protein